MEKEERGSAWIDLLVLDDEMRKKLFDGMWHHRHHNIMIRSTFIDLLLCFKVSSASISIIIMTRIQKIAIWMGSTASAVSRAKGGRISFHAEWNCNYRHGRKVRKNRSDLSRFGCEAISAFLRFIRSLPLTYLLSSLLQT